MGDLSFGRYELVEKIATGGMAEVFRARMRRPGGVNKVVCLKRIHPSLCADPTFVTMFVEEARLGCTLSHGNIVPVFDYGCIDGYHFLVMDFLLGYDLAEVIARAQIVSRPFPVKLAIFIINEVLEGLAYAHGKRDDEGRSLDLVHRDISPSNIMISEAGEVKILDFGIARSALRDFKTRTGVIKGKPGYMAPEQAKGGAVDARTDIYACGVMLCELLTGQRPFGEEPPTTEEADPLDELEGDDPVLASLVLRALDDQRDLRYRDAADMIQALDDYLAESALRPSAGELSRFVDSLFDTPAAAPDWSHQAEAIDRHLAALADEKAEPQTVTLKKDQLDETNGGNEPSRRSTEPLLSPSSERSSPEPKTESFERDEGRAGEGRRRRFVALLLGTIVAIVALVVTYDLVFQAAPDPLPTERTPAPTPEVVPAVSLAKLEVRSRPAGAIVVVDGRRVGGVTPNASDLSPGAHRIEVSLPDHQKAKRQIRAQAGQLVVLDIDLVPSPGVLVVRSEPPGAKVRLDGEVRGSTPLEVGELDRHKSYDLALDLAEHDPWESTVSLDGGSRRELSIELVKTVSKVQPPGFLSINAHPWAEVLLDGRRWGETPVIRKSIRPGRHVLLIRNPARDVEARRVVIVRSGEESRVSVDLTR